MGKGEKIKLCYVHTKPVYGDKSEFASLVPIRTAAVLKERAEVFAIFIGEVDREKLKVNGVKGYVLNDFFSKMPVIRSLVIASLVFWIGKLRKIHIFINIWDHYLLFPIILGARLAGSKVVARVSGIPIGTANQAGKLRSFRSELALFVERASLRLADKIHVLSRSLLREYMKRGISRSRFCVISQGCNTNKFSFKEKSNNKSEKLRRILYVGRLAPKKGLIDALIAFARLVQEYDRNLRFTIVGFGPEKEKLRKLVIQLRISDYVEFLGYVSNDDLPTIYKNSDVLVLPSLSEGLPNVVLEAQASGLVVIGTNVGAIPELLDSGRGIVVKPRDPNAIEMAIRTVFDHNTLREDITQKARNYVVNEHSYKSVINKYLNLFEELLGRPVQ